MPFIKKEPFKPEEVCTSEEHSPPMHMYLEPGRYVWQCPRCKEETSFTVPLITMSV